ncbi:MAG: DUF1611 domain-containing protein [Nitrosomonas sp.]|nr:DUF1611 domain-containing protein [Nitrosomonas sp.]MBP6075538.1 DUF1611 domain-containing protein [Nitrosomonas sp.]
MNISHISQERLLNAKIAYTPRNLRLESVAVLWQEDDVIPDNGDMLLAKVTKVGHQNELELMHNRHSALCIGDEIIVCYGNRYAQDQFEAQVPKDLGACDLVAAGGIAARVNRHHTNLASTSIQPIGLLADSNGKRINLRDTALPKLVCLFPYPYTVAVIGTTMAADQTATAATMIRGLTNAGYTVGVAKVTGTGSAKNAELMAEAGATLTLDFTHAGFPSTYLATPEQIDNIVEMLVIHLSVARVDAIIIEVADGLFQSETAALLNSRVFAKIVDSVILAASDITDAVAGVECLRRKNLPVTAISGRLTASPLAIIEAVDAAGLPVLDQVALSSQTIVDVLQIPPAQISFIQNIPVS